MKSTPLKQFIEEVMAINIGFAGMGGASVGIFGASSTNDDIVAGLRRNAMAFAKAYISPGSSKETLTTLSQELEGSLYSAKLVNGLSDKRLKELITELHSLLESASAK